MIDLIFFQGTEIILIRIAGTDIRFATSMQNNIWCPIDGLKLSKDGAIKQFPDLNGKDNWKEETIKRFKEHISKMKNEREIANYVIDDLKRYGYIPKYKQEAGFRKEKL